MKHTLLLQQGSQTAHEVSLCYKRPVFNEMLWIKTSKDVEQTMRRFLKDHPLDIKEYMWLICMSRANRVLSITELSHGSIFGTVVSIPEIFQTLLLMNSCAFVLVHNHPSGLLRPSASDDALTKQVEEAASLFSIELVDHLIISTEGYYSYRDNLKLTNHTSL